MKLVVQILWSFERVKTDGNLIPSSLSNPGHTFSSSDVPWECYGNIKMLAVWQTYCILCMIRE